MKPLFLASGLALLLLCTACVSHPAASARSVAAPFAKAKAEPEDPSKPKDVPSKGGFGASDAKKNAKGLVSSTEGTATDNHSDVQSKTPDGGKSATTSLTPSLPTDATPAAQGADAPGADADKTGTGKGVGEIASADKTGSDKSADAKTTDDAGTGVAADAANSGPSGGNRPMDGSDPSVAGPSEQISKGLTPRV
jgi:hypothetical protein